jgi:hypothetical protein
MSAPTTVPGLYGSRPPVRKSKLLYWVVGIGGVLAIVILWQFGSALWRAHNLSNVAVLRFHDQLNMGQYEEIIAESDDAFRASGTHEKLINFLTDVHAKLGDQVKSSMTNINLNATANGTFLTTVYSTMFSSGDATETFVWIKKDGSLRLYRYTVNSPLLLK